MANTPTPENTNDVKARANIAYLYTVGALALLGYIVVVWGSKIEILTLIIGYIGGSLIGNPSSVYFGGSTSKKADTNVNTADTVNVNPPVEEAK